MKWIPVLAFSAFVVGLRFVLGAGFTLLGWGHLAKWKYVWRPFKYTTGMAIDLDEFDISEQRFLWYRNIKSSDPENPLCVPHFGLLPFTPVFPLVVFGLSYAIVQHIGIAAVHTSFVMMYAVGILLLIDAIIELGTAAVTKNGWSDTLNKSIGYLVEHNLVEKVLWSLGGVAAVIVSIALFMTWTYSQWLVYGGLIVGGVLGAYMYAVNWMFDNWSTDVEHNDPAAIRELLCPNDKANWPAQFEMLPLERRSKQLWFKTLKNRVCKPMQIG